MERHSQHEVNSSSVHNACCIPMHVAATDLTMAEPPAILVLSRGPQRCRTRIQHNQVFSYPTTATEPTGSPAS